jgi:AraC-like DNA-binding protein
LDKSDMPTALAVPAALRDRVATVSVVRADPAQASPVLPGAAVVLGVQWVGQLAGPGGTLSSAGVTGLQEAARTYRATGPTTSILVRFTPLGATSLGAPVSMLSGQSVALDALLAPAVVRDLVARVQDAPSGHHAARHVIDLLQLLPVHKDPLVARALTLLDSDTYSVRDLARALGISERQLERRFLAQVGLTPKSWSLLRRFERGVERLRHAGPRATLTDTAHDLGYFDQPHFIREFKRRVSLPPRAWLAAQPSP